MSGSSLTGLIMWTEIKLEDLIFLVRSISIRHINDMHPLVQNHWIAWLFNRRMVPIFSVLRFLLWSKYRRGLSTNRKMSSPKAIWRQVLGPVLFTFKDIFKTTLKTIKKNDFAAPSLKRKFFIFFIFFFFFFFCSTGLPLALTSWVW